MLLTRGVHEAPVMWSGFDDEYEWENKRPAAWSSSSPHDAEEMKAGPAADRLQEGMKGAWQARRREQIKAVERSSVQITQAPIIQSSYNNIINKRAVGGPCPISPHTEEDW